MSRLLVQAFAIVAAGAAELALGLSFAEVPECTGTYFLYPVFWLERLAVGSLVISVAAAVVIVVAGRAAVGPALVLLVAVQVMAAMLGTAVAEAQNGCSLIRPDSQVLTAMYVVLPIALSCAAIAHTVAGRAGRPEPRWEPGARPVMPPPGMRLVGAYRVVQSGVAGLPPGSIVWAACSDDELALLDSFGEVGLRLAREGLRVAVEGGATRLFQGRLSLLLLAPLEGVAGNALVTALDMLP